MLYKYAVYPGNNYEEHQAVPGSQGLAGSDVCGLVNLLVMPACNEPKHATINLVFFDQALPFQLGHQFRSRCRDVIRREHLGLQRLAVGRVNPGVVVQKFHIPMNSRRAFGEHSMICSAVQNSGLMVRMRAIYRTPHNASHTR